MERRRLRNFLSLVRDFMMTVILAFGTLFAGCLAVIAMFG